MSDALDPIPTTNSLAMRELDDAMPGRVLAGNDPSAVAAVPAFNTAMVPHPPIVVVAASAADVAATVRIAGRHGLRVRPIGAGHGILAPIIDGIVLVTHGLASVSIDAQARLARVGAGTIWQQVLDAAGAAGLAPLAGSSPIVGVIGYLLGGGLGPIGREYGYAADHVRQFEVVTGTGEQLTVDAEQHPDLFWGLRGGDNGLGIVVSATIELFPIPTLWGGGIYFGASQIHDVLLAWREWAATLPDEFGTSAAILRLPPVPELPEPIRGQTVLHIRAAYTGVPAEGERIFAPMRALGTPLLDTIDVLPYAQLGAIHRDPTTPMPYTEGGILLRDLPEKALLTLLTGVGPDADVPLAAVELRLLGGALRRQPAEPNAVSGRDAAYCLHVVGAPVPELLGTVIPALIDGVFTSMEPWTAPELQANFVGTANTPAQRARTWAPDVLERLDAVRRRYDPASVFA